MYQEAISYYEMIGSDNIDNETKSEVKFKQGYAYFIRGDKANAQTAFEGIKDLDGKYYQEKDINKAILSSLHEILK